MRVTLLGTGGSAGVPLIGGSDGGGNWGVCDPAEPRNFRTRTSILVESDAGMRLLVDSSPDMRSQLLACRVPRVDAVLYTHAHADHITGLDDLRILNRIAGRPLDAFGTRGTLDELTRRFSYAFKPWQPPYFFRPVLVPQEIVAGDTVEIVGLSIRLFEQNHGYTKSLGFRIGNFGYSTDVFDLDDAALTVLEGVDTWVVGCFLRHGAHNTHANLDRVLAWLPRLRPRRTVLTHMGPDMDWSWLVANLPGGVEPGHDGMALDLT